MMLSLAASDGDALQAKFRRGLGEARQCRTHLGVPVELERISTLQRFVMEPNRNGKEEE
jgi:hypothetical protein